MEDDNLNSFGDEIQAAITSLAEILCEEFPAADVSKTRSAILGLRMGLPSLQTGRPPLQPTPIKDNQIEFGIRAARWVLQDMYRHLGPDRALQIVETADLAILERRVGTCRHLFVSAAEHEIPLQSRG
jgi:hypothetical protein